MEAFGLEFHAINLDSDDEAGSHTLSDGITDFEDQAHSVCKATAVFVGPEVCGFGQKLTEKVAVSSMNLYAVKSCLVEELGCVGEPFDNFLDVFLCGCTRLAVAVA